MELVPIRVVIGLKPDGSALYPNFNSLASVVASGQDWSKYVDTQGAGWMYDAVGHSEDEVGSPAGVRLGMLLVPSVFATEAATAFPGKVAILTELQAQDFYDNKHARFFEEEEIDKELVSKLKLKLDLGQTLSAEQLKALDPTDDTPGIRANWRKTFAGLKSKRGISIKP